MKTKAYQYCSNPRCSDLTKTGGLCEKCQAKKVTTDLLFAAKGSVETRKCNTIGCNNTYRGKRMDFTGVCDLCKQKSAEEKHTSWLMEHGEVQNQSKKEKLLSKNTSSEKMSEITEMNRSENVTKNTEKNLGEKVGSIMQTTNKLRTNDETKTEVKSGATPMNINEDTTAKMPSDSENKSENADENKIPSSDLINSLTLLHGESSQSPNLLDSSIKHLFDLMKNVSISKKNVPSNMGQVIEAIEAHNSNSHNVQTAVNVAKTLKEFMKLRLEVAQFVQKSKEGIEK